MASTFFSREELKGFRRWELPEVGESKPAEPAPEPTPALPTVADLEGLEREAREAGYAAGLAEGRAAARDELREQAALLEGGILTGTSSDPQVLRLLPPFILEEQHVDLLRDALMHLA